MSDRPALDSTTPARFGQEVILIDPTTGVPYVAGAASGGATEANQTTELARLGILTETAPASDTASSGLNGRLQRIAQRITSLITALGSPLQAPASYAAGTVMMPYGRLAEVSLTQITMADTYAVTENIGGDAFAIDLSTALGVSMANKWVRIAQVDAHLWGGTITSSGAIQAVFFKSDPSATTWTDSGVTTIDTADKAKARYALTMSSIGGHPSAFGNMTNYLGANTNPNGGLIQCDADGKIWVALQSGGTMTLTTAVLNVNIIIGYDG